MNIKMAFEHTSHHIGRYLIYTLIIFICLFLITIAIFAGNISEYSKKTCNAVLSKGIADTGVISLKNDIQYPTFAYIDELNRLDCIDAAGSSAVYELSGNEFSNIASGKSLSCLFVTEGAQGLCGLELQNGRFKCSGKDITYLYLGSDYAGRIKKGTVIKTKTAKYVVSGFLKKNSLWVNPDITNGFTSAQLDYRISLDDKAVALTDSAPTSGIIFSLSDGCNMDDALSQIKKVSQKYGLTVSAQSVEALYDISSYDTARLLSYLKRIMTVVIFSSMVMIICMQLISVITEKKRTGILYANGFSSGDITGMILWEALFRSFSALLLDIAALLAVCRRMFGNALGSGSVMQIIWGYTLPYAVIVSVAVAFLSAGASYIIIRKYTITELLGEKE